MTSNFTVEVSESLEKGVGICKQLNELIVEAWKSEILVDMFTGLVEADLAKVPPAISKSILAEACAVVQPLLRGDSTWDEWAKARPSGEGGFGYWGGLGPGRAMAQRCATGRRYMYLSPSHPLITGGFATNNKGGRGGRYTYLRPEAHRCAMALPGPSPPIANHPFPDQKAVSCRLIRRRLI